MPRTLAQFLLTVLSVVGIIFCYQLTQHDSKKKDAALLTHLSEEAPPESISVGTDLRALQFPQLDGRKCGTNKDPIKLQSKADNLSHIVIESRKAHFCAMSRIGSSRWKRLVLKAEGITFDKDVIGPGKLT